MTAGHKRRAVVQELLFDGYAQEKIANIGKIKPFEREVNLNADKKRFWLGNLTAINHESNDSTPISLNHFTI